MLKYRHTCCCARHCTLQFSHCTLQFSVHEIYGPVPRMATWMLAACRALGRAAMRMSTPFCSSSLPMYPNRGTDASTCIHMCTAYACTFRQHTGVIQRMSGSHSMLMMYALYRSHMHIPLLCDCRLKRFDSSGSRAYMKQTHVLFC